MTLKKTTISFMYYLLSALGIAFMIKANIGLTCFNAMGMSLYDLTNIKFGTITTVINLTFLLICWFLSKNKSLITYVTMLIALIGFGYVINWILYNVLNTFNLDNYPLRLLIYLLGVFICGYGVGRILAYDIFKFPLENLCQILSLNTNKSFKFYRYLFDVIFLTVSVVTSLAFDFPIYIREGTIIGLFLFAPIISYGINVSSTVRANDANS